jgi:hypothetical protein
MSVNPKSFQNSIVIVGYKVYFNCFRPKAFLAEDPAFLKLECEIDFTPDTFYF